MPEKLIDIIQCVMSFCRMSITSLVNGKMTENSKYCFNLRLKTVTVINLGFMLTEFRFES